MRISSKVLRLALLASGTLAVSLPAAGAAQERPSADITIDLPAMSLDEALRTIGQRSGREIMYPADVVRGRVIRPLSARLSADDAVRALLRDTDLEADFRADVIIIRGRERPSDAGEGPTANPDVIVTGTRIRGAASASPQVSTSRETLRRQGFTDLGSFARSLPQNYSGGQNPGVVGSGGQGSGNENLTSSSTLNLRGLGPDATLTLINGHRVAFDAVSQGIDIAAIPLLAVERIDVVTDGASAIYGSDAVAGVANVILRKSFDGLLTSARVGTTTEGGNTQYQLDAVTGTRWSSGSLMAAASYLHATSVTADQRPFTRSINGSTTIYPEQRQVSGVLVVTQQLADRLRLDLDAQFNRRRSFQATASTVGSDYLVSGFALDPVVRFIAGSPSLTLDLPGGWALTASASYSQSKTAFSNRNYAAGVEVQRIGVRYDDRLAAGEIGAEGPVFALPGGEVRLSLGAGHRDDRLVVVSRRFAGGASTQIQAFRDSQAVTFGYAELFAPLIGDGNAGPLAHRLELSAAARYEDYAGGDGVVSPKLGLVYAPVAPLVLKGTYGRSFKAPTLYQLNLIRNGSVFPPSFLGVSPSGPADAIATVGGGNPDLESERATTWTATAQLAPAGVRGLSLEASYYHISFADRVVTPIASFSGILTNPLYRQLIVFNPTPEQVAAAAASLPLGFTNFTGRPLSALNVIALIDNGNQNAATQKIRGVDLSVRYDLPASPAGTLSLAASASRLRIDQRLSAGQPQAELTGLIFRPPHWRARASADWDRGAVGASGVFNYIGPTKDARFTPFVEGRGFGTFDLVGRVRPQARSGPVAGLEANLSILNVFNRLPDVIRNSNPANPPFESTNYPSLGRVLNLTVLKRW